MRILILSVSGMLGHKMYQVLTQDFDVIGTIRQNHDDIREYGIFSEARVISHVDARDFQRTHQVIKQLKPDVVINCAGIIKQAVRDPYRLLYVWVNSLFPHQLYQACEAMGVRVIHISTDCVFSGKKGNYVEADESDAGDDYGRSKYLGEITGASALTIRTSLIGRELSTSNGLVEWFLSNQGGEVSGFKNAVFSGFPTLHFARIIGDVIARQPDLTGVYHVSSEPISKLELLVLIKAKMGLDIRIKEDSDFVCDRSLDSTLFRTKTGFTPLPWAKMIEEFAEDARQYEKRRE